VPCGTAVLPSLRVPPPGRALRRRTGELDLAIFKGSSGASRPRRARVDLEIPPPPDQRFGVLVEALQPETHVEYGVGVPGIGVERARQAINRLLCATLVVENVGQVVPRDSEIGVGLKSSSIGGLRLELASARAQQVSEIERCC